MGWINQCFVWVTLITTLSYGYKDYTDYLRYHEHSHGHQRELVQNRQSDHSRSNIRLTDRHIDSSESDEQPQQTERSTPYYFKRQRVHVQKRRSPVVTQNDGVRSNENSSFNMVNNVSNSGPAQKGDNRSLKDSVEFSGLISRISSFEPQITDKECLKTGICEHVPNYPENRVVEILKELEGTKYRFNMDKLDTPDMFPSTHGEEVIDPCETIKKRVFPGAIRDINNQWYFVLNRLKNPLQGFRIEICRPTNAPCSSIIYVDKSRYNATCMQKYQYRLISVINSKGFLMEKQFALPSCCSCLLSVCNTENN